MKALLAVASTLTASAITAAMPSPAHADPASDDAAFYQNLLYMGGMLRLRAQENFPQVRLEALRACERITHGGFLWDAANDIQASEPLFKPSDAITVVQWAQDAYCPWTKGDPLFLPPR